MSNHRAYSLYAHITWHTWRRVGCVNQSGAADVLAAIADAGGRCKVRTLRTAVMADHVHLLVSYRPSTRLLGGRVIFPLRGGSSALHLHVGFDANLEEQGDDWYFSITPAVRPLGRASRWYVGTGLALAKRKLGGNDQDVVAHHVLMTGVSLPLGVLGPFLEVRLLDPVRPSVTRLFVFSGVNVRFGGG